MDISRTWAVAAGVTAVALAIGAGCTAAFAHEPASPTGVFASAEPGPADPCGTTGPAQRAAEAYLAAHPGFGPVTVDGVQSAADCAAIRRMQERFGVAGPSGYAGPLTGRIIARVESARMDRCGIADGICVDLTTQTMWALRGGRIVLGPTVVRTGAPGEETPAGLFEITGKKRHTVSTVTGTPMEYWQHLRDGYGFHQAWQYLYDPSVPGSLGCVNLTRRDAEDLWALAGPGTAVRIFGRKPAP
jgi:lipoprotein-anchoring transpeptidase ErfK/SrfK